MPSSPRRQYLSMLWILAWTDFKLRYYGSYLGYVWSLLKPLALFGVLYLVFSIFMRWDVENYQLYLLLGIILWNFFAESTGIGLSALVSRGHIIKKVYFPRVIIVVASTLSTFLGLLLNLIVFAIFALFNHLALSWTLLFFPVVIVILYLVVLGFSLMLSALYVRFRDINQIWEVLLQLGFWLTPVIYPLRFIPEAYQFWLFLNPVTGIIQYARLVVIDHRLPSLTGTGYIVMATLLILTVGTLIFIKIEKTAVEQL